MAENKSLKGKIAIVTGSSRSTGIGAAIAMMLAKQGADVMIHYNRSKDRAQEVVRSLQDLGVRAAAVQGDASAVDFGRTIVDATLSAFETPAIDIIINCAGTIVMSQGIADVPVDSWDQAFHVNARAAFLVIQAALPHMREGGRIVNIGSTAAKLGDPMLPVFSASKAALTAMSVSVADELASKGITINVITPGPIATEAGGIDPEAFTPIATRMFGGMRVKRVGMASEVAEAVRWLTSPLAGYVTGQVIPVDGGMTRP